MILEEVSPEAVRALRRNYDSLSLEELQDIREDLVVARLAVQNDLSNPANNDRNTNGKTWREYQDWRWERTQMIQRFDVQLKVLKRKLREKDEMYYAENNGWDEQVG